MLRSMYSGISGMKVNQTKLDVIGNNIANNAASALATLIVINIFRQIKRKVCLTTIPSAFQSYSLIYFTQNRHGIDAASFFHTSGSHLVCKFTKLGNVFQCQIFRMKIIFAKLI